VARVALPTVPTGGFRVPRRRVRLLAILAVRDGAAVLPGWFGNVGPHVDGVVALDDGSTDGTCELLERQPEVVELLRVPADRPAWDEVGNYKRLVHAAIRHGADWIVTLDADHRIEREFRSRVERAIRRGRALGYSVLAFRMRELWDAPDRYRADGIWGQKRRPWIFRARADHVFDEQPLHGSKAPQQGRIRGHFPLADIEVYHLKMIRPADRVARRVRYETMDPEARYQRDVGYAYLTDENGLRLKSVPPARMWSE